MRTIIAGSRSATDIMDLYLLLNEIDFIPSVVLCGGANGADTLGEVYARSKKITIEYYYPDWELHGKRAGILRNMAMGDNAEALLALWNEESRGTKHMIEYARSKNLIVHVLSTKTKKMMEV